MSEVSETRKHQKTKILGYIYINTLSGHPEWDAYAHATTIKERSRRKNIMRGIIKQKLSLSVPEDAVIDFIKYDEDRIQVYQDLQSRTRKPKANDLSHLFEREPEGEGNEEPKGEPEVTPKGRTRVRGRRMVSSMTLLDPEMVEEIRQKNGYYRNRQKDETVPDEASGDQDLG